MDTFNKLPSKFLERLNNLIKPDELPSVLESFTKKRPTTFRTNTLKISTSDLKKELTNLGFQFNNPEWYLDAFILLNKSQSELMDTPFYKNGFIYIQSLSSMIPALVLDPKEDENILDLTAAPGSKTTQIASIMNNTGMILANDTSRPRLYRLQANLKLQGVTNTDITQLPGQILWERFPEYFDKTLVDVPCSMEGRFYTEDIKTYRDWTLNKVKELVPRQCFLLRSATSATKVGGTIIYSTCTLSPEENEGVIDWILKKEVDNIEIEKISLKNLKGNPALTSFANKNYNKKVKNALRILPSDLMEGFFVAKIKKLKSNL